MSETEMYYGQRLNMGMKFTTVDLVPCDVHDGGSYTYEVGTYRMTMGGDMPEPEKKRPAKKGK